MGNQSLDLYYKKANREGLASIPEPYRTIVAINASQGIIENGGFEYFFENIFPGREKDLNIIVDSYKKLGFDKESAILDMLVQMYFKDKNLLFNQYKEVEHIFFDDSEKIYRKVDEIKEEIEKT